MGKIHTQADLNDIQRIMYEQNTSYVRAERAHNILTNLDHLLKGKKMRNDLASPKHIRNLIKLYGCSPAMASRIFNAGKPTK